LARLSVFSVGSFNDSVSVYVARLSAYNRGGFSNASFDAPVRRSPPPRLPLRFQ